MDVVMFEWFDELNNESQCYFLKTENCDLDIEEWKRVSVITLFAVKFAMNLIRSVTPPPPAKEEILNTLVHVVI